MAHPSKKYAPSPSSNKMPFDDCKKNILLFRTPGIIKHSTGHNRVPNCVPTASSGGDNAERQTGIQQCCSVGRPKAEAAGQSEQWTISLGWWGLTSPQLTHSGHKYDSPVP
ncbi:unnamed protein product [Dicrocoelium dendriticum]|nr:unnamed protein product [Dicrocoelium dendriticum]